MNQTKKSIRLLRDVEANMVPSGDKVTLAEGNLVQITQSLGGNHTVIINGNMAQISSNNADALGIKVEDLPEDFDGVDEGVIVSKIDNSSNSATKILEGDIITDIQSGFQRYSIEDSDSFNEIVSKFQSGDKIAIFGLRGDSRFIVPITVD